MPEGSSWSEPELASLAELATQNITMAQIADELGRRHGVWRTRCAVIGKLQRHRIKHRGRKEGAVERARAMRAKAMKERSIAVLPPPAASDGPPLPDQDLQGQDENLAQDVAQEPVWPPHFIDRLHGQCAYPLWSDAERIGQVCGEPVADGSNLQFCRKHLRKCVNSGR